MLPSETRLSQDYGVGRGTVRRAVSLLRMEGLVDAAAGRGTEVRGSSEQVDVKVPRGARVTSRMPTPDERGELDIPEGVPLLVVTYGGKTSRYPADRNALTHS